MGSPARNYTDAELEALGLRLGLSSDQTPAPDVAHAVTEGATEEDAKDLPLP